MSSFLINREVIDSIRIAREVQLADEPANSKYNRSDLAILSINNGERREFVLEYRKLSTWINTFSAIELEEIRVKVEEDKIRDFKHSQNYRGEVYDGQVLRVSVGTSEIAFVNQKPQVCGNPIELHIIDGVAQKVETIDKEELKRVKKLNAQRKRQERLREQIKKLEDNLASIMFDLKVEDEKVQESKLWLASMPIEEALQNALERRARAREVRRIKAKVEERKPILLDLIELGVIDPFEQDVYEKDEDEVMFVHQASIVTYNTYVERLIEAENHQMKHKPRKSWSKSATKEREKRQERVERVFRDLKWFIDRKVKNWKAELESLEIASYQKHRKRVRIWPKIEQIKRIEIESLELELQAKKRELNKIESVEG